MSFPHDHATRHAMRALAKLAAGQAHVIEHDYQLRSPMYFDDDDGPRHFIELAFVVREAWPVDEAFEDDHQLYEYLAGHFMKLAQSTRR